MYGLIAAHPRAGGENEAGDEKGATFEGSSPRGRGKHTILVPVGLGGGLIPARAGKTVQRFPFLWRAPAHPRAGGENSALTKACSVVWGSSPRGRGKLRGEGRSLSDLRLIPARAGKTSVILKPLEASRAHPRAGGENGGVEHIVQHVRGSSPRGRGKRAPHGLAASGPRAHPRAGGENSHRMAGTEYPEGSSPRGRGKPTFRRKIRPPTRLIPARAGKTRSSRNRCIRPPAHPRAGGENDG